MNFIYNNQKFKFRRKELRVNATKAENLLWGKLRHQQLSGLKFFRQYSVGPCILDFYCPEARLAIELDGAHHFLDKEQFIYDQERTEYLQENDIAIGCRFLAGSQTRRFPLRAFISKIYRYLVYLILPELKIRDIDLLSVFVKCF